MKNILQKYLQNEAGQFALWIGLLGIPVSIAIGAAIDMENGNRYKNTLEGALDSAALAAVQPALLSDDERKKFAQQVFYKNFPNTENLGIKLDIDATREEVTMAADLEVPSFVGGMIGKSNVNVKEKSKAILTKSDTICVLTLDETGSDSLVFRDSAVFNSPTCSVQVNSSHAQAMISKVATPPTARNFCSTGGAIGAYYPSVKTNCSPVADPYKDLKIPPAASSCDEDRQVVIQGNNGSSAAYLESELAQSVTGEAIIPSSSTLSPGIYCKGLKIDGANVQLEPGVYHVWGDLHFTHAAQVSGDGVTFIIKGEENRLLIDEGAEVRLKAPSEGLTAGLVFWQKYLKFISYAIFDKVPSDPERRIATSEIRSGGGLHIVGTAYLPNHKLLISSSNSVSSQSPATSFIAYQVEFAGKANMKVAVDHAAAGLPPMKPSTDEGA